MKVVTHGDLTKPTIEWKISITAAVCTTLRGISTSDHNESILSQEKENNLSYTLLIQFSSIDLSPVISDMYYTDV